MWYIRIQKLAMDGEEAAAAKNTANILFLFSSVGMCEAQVFSRLAWVMVECASLEPVKRK